MLSFQEDISQVCSLLVVSRIQPVTIKDTLQLHCGKYSVVRVSLFGYGLVVFIVYYVIVFHEHVSFRFLFWYAGTLR